MNPKFHCDGPNIEVLENKVEGDYVTHLCVCLKCHETFAIQQTVEQWKRD
jgi:hypothetical protein